MNCVIRGQEIFTISNFLSEEECRVLISKSERTGFEEAKVNYKGEQTMIKSVRNNERVMYKDETYAEFLWGRAKPFILPKTGNSIAIGFNELFRIYKYHPGQQFKMHLDGSYNRGNEEFSWYTFMVYLNEDYTGGWTNFYKGEKIKPETGMALVFEHGLLHEGAVLEEGIKYVLRTDVKYKYLGDEE